MQIYTKRGNTSFKEKEYIRKLQDFLQKKRKEVPSFQMETASNFDELKALHDKYCIEDVAFEEIKSDPVSSSTQVPPTSKETTVDEDINKIAVDIIDPLSREEPIVRDYVMNDSSPTQDTANSLNDNPSREFNEPLTFDETFQMPPNNPGDNKSNSFNQADNREEHTDSSDTGKKKRSTKRFAKYIVATVCSLSEKGFVWYANKDINDAKLAEYEATGEIDLSIIVTLEGGQEATIKQFFQHQCRQANSLSAIDETEKAELADALAEVLMEKGVTPTPTQELMMIGMKIFGEKIITLVALTSQTNGLLAQLRQMKNGDSSNSKYVEPDHVTQSQSQADNTSANASHDDQSQVDNTTNLTSNENSVLTNVPELSSGEQVTKE